MKDLVHNGSIVLTPPSVLRFSRKNSFDAVSRPGCVLHEMLVSPVGAGYGNASEARSPMQNPRSSRRLRSSRRRKGGDAKPPRCSVWAATATKAARAALYTRGIVGNPAPTMPRVRRGLTPLLPVPAPLREDHKVQVNTLHIRWDGIAIPGADRHGLYSWHM